MGRNKQCCEGCGHPSGKSSSYGITKCTACKITEELSHDGKYRHVFVGPVAEPDKKKLVKTFDSK